MGFRGNSKAVEGLGFLGLATAIMEWFHGIIVESYDGIVAVGIVTVQGFFRKSGVRRFLGLEFGSQGFRSFKPLLGMSDSGPRDFALVESKAQKPTLSNGQAAAARLGPAGYSQAGPYFGEGSFRGLGLGLRFRVTGNQVEIK